MIGLVLGLVCAVICAMVAEGKGRNGLGWFFIGFFFGIFGLIAVCIASDVKAREEKEDLLARENRRLQEQLHQERIKSEQFQHQTEHRLDSHDRILNVDTRPGLGLAGNSSSGMLTGHTQPPPPTPSSYGEDTNPLLETGWYYDKNSEAEGPVDLKTLVAHLNQGIISLTTNVWHEQIGKWKPAEQIPCLRRGSL